MKKITLAVFFILFFATSLISQVYKTINIPTAGTLSTSLTATEKSNTTNLTITGVLDARDFKTMRDDMPKLASIDASTVTIQAFSGLGGTNPVSRGSYNYPANEFPVFAFHQLDTQTAKNSLQSISLPTTITSIGEGAFMQCTGISSIQIPSTVVTINNSAFYMCHGLNEVNIPNSVTTIGSYAFQEIENLSKVTLGSKVSNIGLQSFYKCPNLRTIYSNNPTPPTLAGNPFALSYINIVYVPSSGVSAYKNAQYWKDFNIGTNEIITVHNATAGGLSNALRALGKDLTAITTLNVTGFLNNTDISVLKNQMPVLTNLDISGTTITNNILPPNAFDGKNSLVSIKLPESLSVIGDYAFRSCQNITSAVPLPANLVRIGTGAFNGCVKMTGSLNFPPYLTTIGEDAFKNCSSLNGTISFPETITTIGSSAFYSCSNLTGQLVLPNSLTTIGTYAFQNCQSLSGQLILPTNLTKVDFGTFANCSSLSGALNIPASVQVIEGAAFSRCAQITEVNLGGNVATIGDEAFYFCTGINKISSPRTTPPTIYNNTFGFVNKTSTQLQVPYGSLSAYKNNSLWKAFTNMVEVGDTYNLKIISGQNGVIKSNNVVVAPGSVLEVFKNSTRTFTFTPNTGYIVYSLKFNGADVLSQLTTNNQYTTPLITDSSTLEVAFERAHNVSVIITNEAGGSVMDNGSKLVTGSNFLVVDGQSKTFTITPNQGYFVESVKFGGVPITLPLTNNQFATSPITQDASLEVKFTKITYDVTILRNTGGSVKENNLELANNSVLNVDQNAQLAFTIIPDAGYEIGTLTYNGTAVTLTNNQFKTSPINANGTLNVEFIASTKTYNVTVQIGQNGVVKENNIALTDGAVIESVINSTKTFQITADTGYEIDKILYNNQNVTGNLVNGQFTTPLITADASVSVTFKQLAYTLRIYKSDGGSVTNNGVPVSNNDSIEVDPGTSKAFTITPDSGYGINTVLFNGVDVKSQLVNNIFTTGAITGNSVLNVSFEKLTFTITVRKTTGGVVKENNIVRADGSTVSANINEVKTFTITPDPGNVITSLKYGSTNVLSSLVDNTYKTPPVTSDAELNVGFGTISCYLYIKIVGNGTITAAGFLPTGGNNPVNYGSSTRVTFYPATGYELDSLLFDGVDVKSHMVGNTYNTPPATNVSSTLRVVYKKISVDVKILKGLGGKVQLDKLNLKNDTIIKAGSGSTLTFKVTPDAGYEVDSLYFGGVDVKSKLKDGLYTTDVITVPSTLKVTFKKQILNIRVLKNAGGIVKYGTKSLPNDTVFTIDYGSKLTYAIIPDTGFELDSLYLGNVDLMSSLKNDTLTINSVIKSDTLKIIFAKKTFGIKILTNIGGKVQLDTTLLKNDTTVSAEYGTKLSFSITPDEGYELDSLAFGGKDVKADLVDNKYTTDTILKADTLMAVFKKKVFEVKILTNPGGTVKLDTLILKNDTSITTEYGSKLTFSITPDVGYELDSLNFGGKDVQSKWIDNLFTTDSIIAVDTMKVEFKKQVFDVKILANSGGTVKLDTLILRNDTVVSTEYGSKLNFSIIPDVGYELDSLNFGGENVTSKLIDNVFTTDSIAKSDTLIVTFKKIIFDVLVQNNNGGSIQLNSVTLKNDTIITAEYGSKLIFTLVPEVGYELDSVMFGGVNITSKLVDNVFTSDSILKSDTLMAVFKKIIFNVNIQVNTGGSTTFGTTELTNDTSISTEYGSTLEFTITPDKGYEIDSVYFGGKDVLAELNNGVFITEPLYKADTLKVVFKKQVFDITIQAGSGGKVKIESSILENGAVVKAEYGSEIKFTIVADKGFLIESISYNGQTIEMSSDSLVYRISSISANGTFEVSFKNATSVSYVANPYNIKVYTVASGIAVEGVSVGDIIRVFTLSGAQVANTRAESESVIIPIELKNMYLVNVKGSTFKVILR